MIDAIPGALSEFDGLRLDAIVFGCTSAEARYDMLVNQREGCEWFTALHSLIYATKSSGVHNVLLVAPYDPFTMAAEKAIVNREGINVIRDVFLPYEDEIRHIATAAIVESVQENFSPECDGVLLSCTAMYTIEAVAALSLLLPPGCLITSSNLALATRLNNACTFKQSKQGQQ
jgi:maleate cis-trans isomerase